METYTNTFDFTIVSFDTETSSLDYITLDLEGFSFCNGEKAFYVDLINNSERHKIITHLNTLFKKVKILVGHNLVFDLKVLRKCGINLASNAINLFDTMVADHLLDENKQSHSLKYLAQHILNQDVTAWKDIKDRQSKEFHNYALNDVIWTWKLMLLQRPQLKAEELINLFTKIEMPFQWVLVDLETNGFKVDLEEVKKTTKQLNEEINKLKLEMLSLAGASYEIQTGLDGKEEIISDLNLNSSQQLSELLFEKLQLPIVEITPSGKPSVGRKTIEKLKDKHPFVLLLSKYKIAMKLLTSFFLPLPELVDEDGRVRPNFRDIGTVTGRLSCNNPNLQQLPKVNKEFPIDTRKCFIAPKGKKLLACDYSGQELRVLAELSQEPVMIDIFNKGKDMHLSTANDFFNLNIPDECLYETNSKYEEYKERFKNERFKAKTINFGMAYGKGAYGFSKDFGITEEEAQEILDKYFATLPKVREAMDKCHNQVKSQGYVTSMTGRRRRFTPIKSPYGEYYPNSALRQAFNFLIQGYSADMMRMAMIKVKEIAKQNPKWKLKTVATVHDEAVYEVAEDFIVEASKAIREAFESITQFRIPIIAEIAVGNNYGECK